MKKKIFLPLFLTTFLLSGYPTLATIRVNPPLLLAQSIWKSFSSEEGGFKVLMPGKPIPDKNNTTTQVGSIPTNVFVVPRPEASYIVAYSDFPNNITLNSPEVNELLSQVNSSFAKRNGVSVANQQDISLGNLSGREVRLEDNQGFLFRWRAFAVNKRLYQIGVATNKEASLTKSIEGFFTSFQLMNLPPSPEELNANLQQAVCSQNWDRALAVIDQMLAIAPSPDVQSQLTAYRSRLQGLANSRSRIPPQSLPGCAAKL